MRPLEVETPDQIRIFTHPVPRAGRNAVFLPTEIRLVVANATVYDRRAWASVSGSNPPAPKEGCRTKILPYYAVNVYNRPDGYSRTTRTETTGLFLCVFL